MKRVCASFSCMTDPVDPAEYYSTAVPAYDAQTAEQEMPRAFLDVRDRFTDMVDGDRVLDAGCGPGRDTDHFAGEDYDAVGVDIAGDTVEYAWEQGRDGEYAAMDIGDLAFEDDSFDGVWCNAALFFVPPDEMEEMVEELYRVQTGDGVAQFALKLGDGSITKQKDEADVSVEQYLVPEADAVEMLEDAGYSVVDRSTADFGEYRFGNFFCRAE